jgi:hypothetical protein
VDRDSLRIRQRSVALVRSAKELTEALAMRSSRFVSRQEGHTVSVRQPKRSRQRHLWRLVDPQDLGEFPPLEGLDWRE